MMRRPDGFTMIELLMAMAVFSFMMLIVSAGFIQVVRIQQSGIASRTTQQNARLVIDSITKDVRISAAVTTGNPGQLNWLCLNRGSQTLEYAVDPSGNLQVGAIANPPAGTCPVPAFGGTWRTLNDAGTQVTQLTATTTPPIPPGLGTAMVTLTLVSRNNLTALDATKTHCVGGASGAQFCAVTTLSSGASLRGGDGL
jgi:prepilin-type N-terminal cleavage/methylation domain-containing protein